MRSTSAVCTPAHAAGAPRPAHCRARVSRETQLIAKEGAQPAPAPTSRRHGPSGPGGFVPHPQASRWGAEGVRAQWGPCAHVHACAEAVRDASPPCAMHVGNLLFGPGA
eukprot:scaffold14739_cov107-Isochrysis_galbana.AAC.2